MPSERERRTLQNGDEVKLMFDIALLVEDDSETDSSSLIERMWVIVTGKVGPYYLGELNNVPATSGE